MPKTLKIALLQHACPPSATKAENVERCCAMVREAAASGAALVVTQELFAGHYFCQVEDDALFDWAEPIPGPTSNTLAELARELKVTISASLFERRLPGVYHNTTVTLGPDGKMIGKYRKMHIPDDPRFYEKYYFTPGDLGWQSFDLPMGASSGEAIATSLRDAGALQSRVGTLVCWDQWFPEAARLTAMQGAELLLYPTAIGYYNDAHRGEPVEVREQQLDAWQTIMRSHAIANGVYVAAANRIGTENDLTFWGSSFVVGPDGKVIAQASRDQQEILYAELDLEKIEPQRRGWPFLRDRRIDAYDPLLKRLSIQ